MIEAVDYHGWKTSYRVSNRCAELYATTDIGPRIVDFRFTGRDNVFYLRTSELGRSGEPDWVFRGGWRLWSAPESRETTYVPDNTACHVECDGDWRIRLTSPHLPNTPVQKSVEICLSPEQPRVRITSTLTNISPRSLTCSAWSLSVMQPGGRALVPLDIGNPTAFADVRRVILWSYARWQDPRYIIGDTLVQVDHRLVPTAQPAGSRRRLDESKIGVDSAQGWAGYLRGDILYLKQFEHVAGGSYPDGGSTIEVYSNAEFLELENLSPLVTLAPGEDLNYSEEWALFASVPLEGNDREIAHTIAALR